MLVTVNDTDGDGVPDATDNCPLVPNPTSWTRIWMAWERL